MPAQEEELLDVVQNDSAKLVLRKNDFVSSTKLDALLVSLRAFPYSDSDRAAELEA